MPFSIIASLALAQAAAALPPVDRAAHYARLDVELAEQDYGTIGDIVFKPASTAEAAISLDWLGERFKTGGSPYIAFSYARLLLAFAEQLPAEQAKGLKGTALAALLYASSASQVDGLQCGDGTARASRADQFRSHIAQSCLLEMDEASRRQAAGIAVWVEALTWERRRTRDEARFQCFNGMAAMSAGIATGQVRERPADPGEVGRQMVVKAPDGFVYQRRPDAEWWRDAEGVRQQLPALVAALARVEAVPTREQLLAGSQ